MEGRESRDVAIATTRTFPACFTLPEDEGPRVAPPGSRAVPGISGTWFLPGQCCPMTSMAAHDDEDQECAGSHADDQDEDVLDRVVAGCQATDSIGSETHRKREEG